MADRSLLGRQGSRGGDSFDAEGTSTRKKLLVAIVVTVVVIGAVIGLILAVVLRPKAAPDLAHSLAVDNILGHLSMLNELADTKGNGSRSVVDAYNASASYVISKLQESNFCDVQLQQFQVPIYEQLLPPTLSQVAPYNLSYVLGIDFSGTRYGGNNPNANVQAEIVFALNYGCIYPDDYQHSNFTERIAVAYAGGSCTPYDKALNAEKASAAAILVVNTRGSALSNWRVRSVEWNISSPLVQIPVLGITYSLGAALQQQVAAENTTLRVTISTQVTIEDTYNVFCLTRKGTASSILVAGAHLDSVPEGPGINDNGSGSSSVLEIALEVARSGLDHTNKILFAWWGAEEIGLLGSRYFVDVVVNQTSQDPPEGPFNQTDYLEYLNTSNVLLGLNFDMLGSPNGVRYVYTSVASTPVVNNASSNIQALFQNFFIQSNSSFIVIPMSGGSDFLPFVENEIPAGALATGAGSFKSENERILFGGLANAAYDPCYHLSCDTNYNIDADILHDMSTAAAYVIQQLAQQSDLRKFLYNETTPTYSK